MYIHFINVSILRLEMTDISFFPIFFVAFFFTKCHKCKRIKILLLEQPHIAIKYEH